MFYQSMQMVVGLIFLYIGAFFYTRDANVASLVLLVLGAISVTASSIVRGVRQALKDERKRAEQEGKPVLNI